MKIAFYAPLKPPDSLVPSGDRLIARMFIEALVAGGHDVQLASRFRSLDHHGDAVRQNRLERVGRWQAQRIIRRFSDPQHRPDLWLTYHIYYKAPDWLGPEVTRALGIPYCIAEASVAARHAQGPWAAGAGVAVAAVRQAQLVISINPKDVAGIQPFVAADACMVLVQPFIDGRPFVQARGDRETIRANTAQVNGLSPEVPWLLTVGMFRAGDKLASYQILAKALARLLDRPWQLIVVGAGGADALVRRLFEPFGGRVRFFGARTTHEIAQLMAASDVFVWPAVNEAIGMVFIEAAMAGLPSVGANRPGIAAIVDHNQTGLLVAETDPDAFADAVARLLDDGPFRVGMGAAAAARAVFYNSLATAGPVFCRHVEALIP
jgi:glycosyltransferase involved in cell wall biosynthesis